MLLTIMMAPQYGPSTTVTAEVAAAEWERVSGILLGTALPPPSPGLEPLRIPTSHRPRVPVMNEAFLAAMPREGMPTTTRCEWAWTTEVSGAVVNKHIGINHTNPSLATELRVTDVTTLNFDASAILASLEAGSDWLIQDENNAGTLVEYQTTGPGVDQTDWWTFPIKYVQGGDLAIANNQNCTCFVTLAGSGSTFLKLADTPAAYDGAGGYVVSVKDDLSGLEFTPRGVLGSGGAGSEGSAPLPWMQCIDPKTKWAYLINMAEVVRIGPAHADETP